MITPRKPRRKMIFGVLLEPDAKTEKDYRKIKPKRHGRKHPWRAFSY